MISAMTFLQSLTADPAAVVNGCEPSNAPECDYSNVPEPDGREAGGIRPAATGGDGPVASEPCFTPPKLNAVDLLAIDFIEGREPVLLPSRRLDGRGRQADRDTNGETPLQRAERWQREAAADRPKKVVFSLDGIPEAW